MDGQVANPNMGTVQAVNSHTSSEVCSDDGHSGNNCPETQEEAAYVNNGFRPPQQGNNGWNNQHHPQGNFFNQPSLKDLVLGQAKINENLTKKLPYNDKIIENINAKLETLFFICQKSDKLHQDDRNTDSTDSCINSSHWHREDPRATGNLY